MTGLVLDAIAFERPGGFRLAVDLAIGKGERVALIGASGSGKSTLLDLVAGFEDPASGRILFSGSDITGLPPAARPVTMLFQDDNLFAHLDAFTNVALGRSPALRLSAADRAAVADALATVGLAGKEGRLPGALSGGERQRVAIARALLRDRPLLLLDEPFASLGPALSGEMLALVAEIAGRRAMTVILVTHDPAEALAFAPRMLYLEDGRVIADGPTGDLLAAPSAPGLRRYLGG